MSKPYLWQVLDFSHFYYNPAVVEPLEVTFKQELKCLDAMFEKQDPGTENVFTEDVIANSEIEGVLLDWSSQKLSHHTSFGFLQPGDITLVE